MKSQTQGIYLNDSSCEISLCGIVQGQARTPSKPEERPIPPKLDTHQGSHKEPEVFHADPLSPIAFLPTNQEGNLSNSEGLIMFG